MAWHITKTSALGSAVGTVYYKGDKRWTETYADRATYSSQAKAKAESTFIENDFFPGSIFESKKPFSIQKSYHLVSTYSGS